MVSVFFSYCHADETLRDQLEIQLAALKRQGVIETWHDRRIGAGEELNKKIDDHVNHDDIILLLVSPDFIASDYCYNIEMARAMERHNAGNAIVIPVILRLCDWHSMPFGKLMATPPDGKPITRFPDRDEAMLEVAKAIRRAAERLNKNRDISSSLASINTSQSFSSSTVNSFLPRSSNLALKKNFTDRDLDLFKNETFEYIARFFENSVEELSKRNPGIEGDFRRIDTNRFTTNLYKEGKTIARCTIFIGDQMFANGIAYSTNTTMSNNTLNDLLTIKSDDQSLFLTNMGGREQKLTQEGAAEHYWSSLIRPLQPR